MAKSIENIISFPVNAQRNSFFGALSSILLYRNAYTEDTPFFCGKHQRNCIRCGDCGNEPFINKHHLKIYQKLETEPDGKKLGKWLNQINGLAIETRWYASDLHFHDQAWKIWALLGVSPQTFYCLPRNINELLSKSSTRAELKSLFQEIFTIDRQVSHLLQECLSLL